jgi:SAM-dependent methyltransferase
VSVHDKSENAPARRRPLLPRLLGAANFCRTGLAFLRDSVPRQRKLLETPCALCRFPRLVRLFDGEAGVRCPKCLAGVTRLSVGIAVETHVDHLAHAACYELSAKGPLFRFLSYRCASVTGSEFWPDVPPGEWRNQMQCQDVEQLTYPDACFDLVTSTEVFEHVPNDAKGFREVHRVLTPGGALVFSVPLLLDHDTIERARLVDGKIEHLTEPEYHDDRIRGKGGVLAFRTYGMDIVERLRAAGFRDALIDTTSVGRFDGDGRAVVVAMRR